FHANAQTRYETVDQAELHSRWSLAEARRHELAAMQEAFVGDWLFHRDEARATAELSAYGEAELAAGDINLRFARLAKLSKGQPNWTFYTPGFERSVLRYLSGRWPLEYHQDAPDRPRQRATGPRP
ncbi:MAG TPA: hypothetical protein VEV21_01720, partial [Burkholderiales bacterium]|nr:hypothetical protein [Burkholderiales bacterium]